MEEAVVSFSWEWWEIFLGGIGTFAIFSFLYRENPFYRVFEHFFIGIATSWGIISTIRQFFWPNVLRPMLGLDRVVFPGGAYQEPYDTNYLLFLVPMVFGLLYYFIGSKKWNWLAQIVIGFGFGVSAGLTFRGVFNESLPQIYDSWRPLVVFAKSEAGVSGGVNWGDTLSNIVFLITLLTAMCYFFFTFKRVPGGMMERTSNLGRWLLMACFGAFFGSTIMARMALVVERLQFLINQWFPAMF